MHVQKVSVRVGVVLALALVTTASWAGSTTRTEFQANLTATSAEPLASGKAKFERRGTRLKFSTEVEDLAHTSTIRVTVNGKVVGTAPVVLGAADLNLDTLNGQTVPSMGAGATVRVFNATTGTLILSGQLRRTR